MIFILIIVGACLGAAVNWCIYNLGDEKRAVSPWSTTTRRPLIEKIPILGWWSRPKKEPEHGTRFWIRPLAIELVWAIGLPALYLWLDGNGLTDGVPAPAGWTTVWFAAFSILFAFLTVATFIDFDQRIIPDAITIPGTLVALIIAACFPESRLPEVVGAANLAGLRVDSVDFADAQPIGTWHQTLLGFATVLIVYAVWITALLPKFSLVALDLKSLKFVFASTIRFLQKNSLKVRSRTRRTGLCCLTIGAVGIAVITVAWMFLPAENCESLVGSFLGLGFGGLMVWSVRIVASHSLGREAMGFGDVTLMAMIGAFLGWQASLIVFALSPFAALAIVFASYLITRENELAFGPYLCLGALITVLWWPDIWPYARVKFFLFPKVLLLVLAGSLVLLMVMMLGIRVMRGPEDQEPDSKPVDG